MKPGIRRLIEELRGARVLVVHPRDAEGDALLDQLKVAPLVAVTV